MKILGVTIDSDMSFRSHINQIASRLRARMWALAKLRKKGLPTDKLIRAYTALIRPVGEYACPAWHSLITADQAAYLECQQTQALKNIYGLGMSAEKMRKKSGIELLSTRRLKIMKKFASKCVTNQRTSQWFQERRKSLYERRTNITYPRYHEPVARTDRYQNSPRTLLSD